MSNLELEDCKLCNTYIPVTESAHTQSQRSSVLLTGARGFLGAVLLKSLLEDPELHLTCLVRGQTIEQARLNLGAILSSLGDTTQAAERVELLIGDITKPLLGLSSQRYDELSETVDSIVHSAANVSFLHNYDELRETNVLGTANLLKLCCQGRAKRFVFISSISSIAEVAVLSDKHRSSGTRINEETPLPATPQNLPWGYARSKWVAEHMIEQVGSQGLNYGILRPTLITGHSSLPYANDRDIFAVLLNACAIFGAAPQLEAQLDFIPVDYVAKVAHAYAFDWEAPKCLHLIHPAPLVWHKLLELMNNAGVPLKQTSLFEWKNLAMTANQRANNRAKLPRGAQLCSLADKLPGLFETLRHISDDISAPWLGSLRHNCPALDQRLILHYLNTLLSKSAQRSAKKESAEGSISIEASVTGS